MPFFIAAIGGMLINFVGALSALEGLVPERRECADDSGLGKSALINIVTRG